MLVGVENNLSQVLFKLEQYRETNSNLEKDIEENIKCINNQEFALSAMDSEQKKLHIDIQNTLKKIDLENKLLENLKKQSEVSLNHSLVFYFIIIMYYLPTINITILYF